MEAKQTLSVHEDLLADVEKTMAQALTEAYVEKPDAPQSQLLLGLAVHALEHIRSIRSLLAQKHYTQILIICRSCLEGMAMAYGIVRDEKTLKLLEKKSLEQFKKRLDELGLLNRVGGLDETIQSIHFDSTSKINVQQLLGDYCREFWKADRNLLYASYRELCDFTHPEYQNLVGAVELLAGGRGMRLNPHHSAAHAELLFGGGVSSAISTFFILVFDNTGIQFSENSCVELGRVLSLTLDLVGKKDTED